MNRRFFLKLSGCALLGTASNLSAASIAADTTVKHAPNIVFVMADDLSPYELGCYGQKKIRTPNIDRLAREGMRFDTCYSSCPVCSPSRCGLLTGKHMGHAQIRNNWEAGRFDPKGTEGQWPLTADTETIARVLKRAGYVTGAFGKWGMGGPHTDGQPMKQGFDRFYGYNCQRHAHQYWTHFLRSNNEIEPLDNPIIAPHQRLPKKADPNDPKSYERYFGRVYAPDRILEEAEKFVKASAGKPMFLYYATPLPHVGLTPPEKETDAYNFPETPYRGQQGYAPQRRPRAAYAAMVSRIDREVGRIAELLKASGEYDNTLFIFTGDNGTTFNGGTDRKFFNATHNLRAHKGSVYEGGLRVPFVAAWPGKIPAGTVTTDPIWHVDMFATFCHVASLPAPKQTDGTDIVPLLTGEAKTLKRPPFYWEFSGWQALRRGSMSWIRPPRKPTELYDRSTDPGERKNLAATRPDLVREGEALMKGAHIPHPQFPLPDEKGNPIRSF